MSLKWLLYRCPFHYSQIQLLQNLAYSSLLILLSFFYFLLHFLVFFFCPEFFALEVKHSVILGKEVRIAQSEWKNCSEKPSTLSSLNSDKVCYWKIRQGLPKCKGHFWWAQNYFRLNSGSTMQNQIYVP